jgi:hypothetical protein
MPRRRWRGARVERGGARSRNPKIALCSCSTCAKPAGRKPGRGSRPQRLRQPLHDARAEVNGLTAHQEPILTTSDQEPATGRATNPVLREEPGVRGGGVREVPMQRLRLGAEDAVPGAVVVRVAGELNRATAPRLARLLDSRLDHLLELARTDRVDTVDRRLHLIVDLAEVGTYGAGGLSVLRHAQYTAAQADPGGACAGLGRRPARPSWWSTFHRRRAGRGAAPRPGRQVPAVRPLRPGVAVDCSTVGSCPAGAAGPHPGTAR